MASKQIPKAFTESEVGTLIEHFDSKLDLVVEGHAALDKKIDDFKVEVAEKFKEVDYKFETVFERFDGVDERFNHIDDELHVIRNELKEKVGRDEFQLLEKRVAALEKRS